MLIKRISQTLKKPVFEIMTWPYDELLIQQVFFSIDDNGPGNSEPEEQQPIDSEEAHVAAMKGIFT